MRRELNSSGSDYGKKKKLTWILKCMSYLVMECLNLIILFPLSLQEEREEKVSLFMFTISFVLQFNGFLMLPVSFGCIPWTTNAFGE